MRMKGKVGIVTAAASGMGRAGATLLAREGASVSVVDIDGNRAEGVAREIRDDGGTATVMCGDLTDDAFCRRIVGETASAHDGLDFLWCHAGHPGPKAFEDLDMADYELAMTLNLRAAVVSTAEAIPHLRERGGGSVLFTSSTNGVRGAPNSPVYGASKFAVVGLARSLARRHGPDRIRFNAICPGVIDTPMLGDFFSRGGLRMDEAEIDRLKQTRKAPIPLGRLGRPEDIAWAALYLLSDESSFVTGTELCIDGGTTA